ncbi:MAG: hypothetical protein LUG88_03355 [Clostridia bacterium]|nr:hypothetical protein [Clostridia bacterium]
MGGLDLRGCGLYDMWKHKSVGTAGEKISAKLPAHGSVIYRIS